VSELEVRSYRSVFCLERRIYRIDTLRLNPAGVPLRGVVYAAVLAAAALCAGALPGVALLLSLVPWYLRDLALPALVAAGLTILRIDGRVCHLALLATLRHRLGPRRLNALQPLTRARASWRPPPIRFLVDGSESTFRALRYRGPGAVLVCRPHERLEWRAGLPWRRRVDVSIHPIEGSGAVRSALELPRGCSVEVSSRPRRRAASRER
jgi:hypothetical protein